MSSTVLREMRTAGKGVHHVELQGDEPSRHRCSGTRSRPCPAHHTTTPLAGVGTRRTKRMCRENASHSQHKMQTTALDLGVLPGSIARLAASENWVLHWVPLARLREICSRGECLHESSA